MFVFTLYYDSMSMAILQILSPPCKSIQFHHCSPLRQWAETNWQITNETRMLKIKTELLQPHAPFQKLCSEWSRASLLPSWKAVVGAQWFGSFISASTGWCVYNFIFISKLQLATYICCLLSINFPHGNGNVQLQRWVVTASVHSCIFSEG